MTEQLKKCPACGSEFMVMDFMSVDCAVHCSDCDMRGPHALEPQEARDLWDEMPRRHAKPLVYISSPYTEGDQLANAADAMMAAREMIHEGVVTPLSPVAMCAMQLVSPMTHAEWMAYDLDLMDLCDAMLVVGSRDMVERSKGVRAEREYAAAHGIPIFWTRPMLYEWEKGRK